MQIRPHTVRPANDLPSPPDHSCEAVLDHLVRCELQQVEASLAAPPSPEPPRLPELPPAAAPQPLATSASSQAPPRAIVRRGSKRGPAAAVAAVVVMGGMLGGAGIMMRRPSRPSPGTNLKAESVHASDVRAPSVPPSGAVESARPPKWVRTRQSGWATDGSRTIAFQVEAENDVPVWMKRVRPVLGVRCLGRQVEAFVMTDSAASIEPAPDQHTVHVGFDGEAEVETRWFDSESKRELFAPDGDALARQLARAHTMRFGFTPYHASAVVVDFDVRGFAQPLDSIYRTCSWRSNKKPNVQRRTR